MAQAGDHTFIAPTLREALEKAQSELGPSALFVSHRELGASARHPYLGRRVEVTVRLPDEGDSELAPPPRPSPEQDVLDIAPVRASSASDELIAELRSLRHEVDLLKGRGDTMGPDPIERRLRASGLSPGLAKELRRRMATADAKGALAMLRQLAPVRVPSLRREAGNGPRILSLVGPTGVGKTTTLAKLAGRYSLAGGKGLALVTIDTYRVAAADQLRAYADMLRVPCRVAFTPEDLRRILSELSSSRLILIDTTGRSPLDEARVGQLAGFLADQRAIEHYLCLSATTAPAVLLESARRFQTLPLAGTIITKIDEALHFGPLLDLAQRTKLPFAFLTNGQEVPEDIEDAKSEQIASLIWEGRELTAEGPA
ncbi:MAG: hypothetical protein RL885_14385 [Planctomycetota bacterium]